MKHLLSPLALASVLALAACSSNESATDSGSGTAATRTASATSQDSAPDADRSAATFDTEKPPSADAASPITTLALEGLGDLVIGKPVPKGSSFAQRGAQISDACHTISSPGYPGVYAITEHGEVRRITVGERSEVKLAEGIGVGSSEAEVLKAFPGFRSTPHKYVAAPGKYLTQPGNDPRLRFEIGADGRVSQMHVGLMPQLGYVEGCA